MWEGSTRGIEVL
ncbi:hypothetical protein CFP56_011650 [Quercus suber]|uniref:Uncharacterized protein n=1 Tax=Quercus suber TaxID=58331 RepID=A0AAW0KZT7_QUESU